MLDLSSKKMIGILKEIQFLEEEFIDPNEITSAIEILAYDAKKRFVALKKKIILSADGEISKLDDLIIILAGKPEWVTNEELKDILEDLRPVVTILFSALERLRAAGEVYLKVNDEITDFPEQNRLSAHCSAVKTGIALLAIDLKKSLPYLSLLFKEVQGR